MSSRPLSTARARSLGTRRSGRVGGWALWAAFLCLLAQGAGIAHLALVSHVQCYAHDELVHAPATAEGAGARDQDVAATRNRAGAAPVALQDVSADASHADDHCLAVGLRKREAIVSAPAATGVVGHVAINDGIARQAAVSPPPASVPLLLLAPKSSPPAQA